MSDTQLQAAQHLLALLPLHGGLARDVQVARDRFGGLGLFLTKAVSAGSELLHVPRACMLEPCSPPPSASAALAQRLASPPASTGSNTTDEPDLDNAGDSAHVSTGQLPEQCSTLSTAATVRMSLALSLLQKTKPQESGASLLLDAEWWSTYAAALPTKHDGLNHIPLIWPCEDADALLSASDSTLTALHQQREACTQELQYAPALTVATAPSVQSREAASPESQAAGAADQHQALEGDTVKKQQQQQKGAHELQQAKVGGHLDAEEYKWSRCIITSRAISLWGGPTLVPLVDFLNHCHPPSVMCRCHTDDKGVQTCVVEAIRDMQAGDELLWNYCAHDSDAAWLLNYGFVPKDGSSLPFLDEARIFNDEGSVNHLQGQVSMSLDSDGALCGAAINDLDVHVTAGSTSPSAPAESNTCMAVNDKSEGVLKLLTGTLRQAVGSRCTCGVAQAVLHHLQVYDEALISISQLSNSVRFAEVAALLVRERDALAAAAVAHRMVHDTQRQTFSHDGD